MKEAVDWVLVHFNVAIEVIESIMLRRIFIDFHLSGALKSSICLRWLFGIKETFVLARNEIRCLLVHGHPVLIARVVPDVFLTIA